MKSYTSLLVWQKNIDLVELLYRMTAKMPNSERFGLVSQMQRSAISIPSNIAEGHDRKSNGEFSHFLKISLGSSSELETQLLIAYRLKMLNKKEYDEISELLVYVRKMLSSLLTKTSAKLIAIR